MKKLILLLGIAATLGRAQNNYGTQGAAVGSIVTTIITDQVLLGQPCSKYGVFHYNWLNGHVYACVANAFIDQTAGGNGNLTANMTTGSSGLVVTAASGITASGLFSDAASGSGLFTRYNKSANAGQIGVTGGSDSLFFQSQSTNRVKLDQNGQLFVLTTPSAGVAPFTTTGIIVQPSSTDPGCTQSFQIGKLWLDNTTTTTAYKVCLSVSGTIQWVTK